MPVPSLEQEFQALLAADERIAHAEAQLAHQRGVQQELLKDGHVGAAADALRVTETMRGMLEQYREHRKQVVRMIDDIRAGRIPNSDKSG
jgi:hypothetical protein